MGPKGDKSATKSIRDSPPPSVIKLPDVPEKLVSEYEGKTVTITVKEMHITPTAGRPTPSDVKIQIDHLEKMIAESETIECNQEGSTKINFTAELVSYPSKPGGLDELVSNPIIITVLEAPQIKPGKDSARKSVKQEKVTVFGRSNFDLLPLALGEKRLLECLLLEQEKKAVGQDIITWPNLPRLFVTAEISDFLIPPKHFKQHNVLHVTIESMHNLMPGMTEHFQYKAAMAFPICSENLQTIIFENGTYAHNYEPENWKKWSVLSYLEGRVSLSNYSLSKDLQEIKIVPKFDLPQFLDQDSPCIEWLAMRRCWLDKPAIYKIFNTLAKYKCWPIELQISSAKGGGSAKSKSKAKVNQQDLHFIAYLDLTALLYPGITNAHAAAQLFTFNSNDAKEKWGLEKSLFDTDDMEEGSYTHRKKADQKTTKSLITAIEEERPSEPLFTDDGKPVFIIVQVELLRPLIEKRDHKVLIERLLEAIPPREELPKQVMSADLADAQYTHCIKAVSDIISKEFQDYCLLNQITMETISSEESILDDIFINMQGTGVFGTIVDILRDKVTVLIREKYNPGATINSNEDKQNFVSEVYTNLIEEMHSVLHSYIAGGPKVSEKTFDVTPDQKYHFAIEATEEGENVKARKLYLERISKFKNNPDYWIEYALYCIRIGDIARGRECIREGLSLHIRHPVGLLVYGILLAMSGDLSEAELFFEGVTFFHPRIIEAWIIFHLFYLKIDKIEGADITLRTAMKLVNQYTDEMSYMCVTGDVLAWTRVTTEKPSIFLHVTEFLLKIHAYEFSELALAQEISNNGTSSAYKYYLSVGHYLSGRYAGAISHLQSIVDKELKNYQAWCLLGHCYYKAGNKEKAAECYDFVVDACDRPEDIHLVNVRLGTCYLQENNYEKATENFIEACIKSPTPATWLGLGTAYFMAGKMDEAEKAFAEANMLDPHCPSTWSYLCLVNLHLDREEEYQQCYSQLLKNQDLVDITEGDL